MARVGLQRHRKKKLITVNRLKMQFRFHIRKRSGIPHIMIAP